MRDLKSQDPNQERDVTRQKGGRQGAIDSADQGIQGNDAAAYGTKEHEGEETRELTGFDAPTRFAEAGDAGDGASPNGADFSSMLRRDDEDEEPPNLEASPDEPGDIGTDHLEDGVADPAEDDRELTVRPRTGPQAITPDELPAG
ncbi:MAG: hypothetical protein ACT4TC_20105 [Myxococcaceae bacterium]